MKRLSLLVALCGSMILGSVEAALVTHDLRATVIGSRLSSWSPGDIFDFGFTYDHAGTDMRVFNDGLDGIAGFGNNDDSISYVLTTSTFACCTAMSQATSYFSGLFSTHGAAPANYFQENASLGYTTIDTDNNFNLFADDFMFFAETSSVTGRGQGQATYYFIAPNTGDFQSEEIYFDIATLSISGPHPVSTSDTLALLAIGLLGLANSRRCRKPS